MNDHRISRRSFLAAAGIAGAAAALTACGGAASSTAASVASSAAASSQAAQSVELIVFAAASLTETLTAIGEIYSAENPGVTFRFNFDSSGTLKTQIQEGADCDLFISAGQKQMDQLDIMALADVNKEGWTLWTATPAWTCWKTRWCSACRRAATRASTALTLWPST